ncbi:TPA: PIN domain-containing protein [bacterium]|jgi:predicted nucleic acid-binding protein|nr:PIN domain-containing protein [bacterium]
MICYIDTSALLAILDADDKNHVKAKQQWTDLVIAEDTLVCSDYVLVESLALIQHRIGLMAVKVFHEDIFPILTVEWVDESIYQAGIASVLISARRDLSLVDCISFETMRRLGIQSAFSFDKHFKEQGFSCLP